MTEAVDILIDHAREHDPNRRFATAGEIRDEIDRISMVSLKGRPNQYLRVALAWLSERYEKLASRRSLAFILSGLIALLAKCHPIYTQIQVGLLARLFLPLLLNSLLVSILFDWVIRAFARRRRTWLSEYQWKWHGRHTWTDIYSQSDQVAGVRRNIPSTRHAKIFAAMLTIVIFETVMALGIILAIAWTTERYVYELHIWFLLELCGYRSLRTHIDNTKTAGWIVGMIGL